MRTTLKFKTTAMLVVALLFGYQTFSQTCTANVSGTQALSTLSWTSAGGAICPPASPYTGNVTINGPGNGDTLIVDVNFEMTGILTVNGIGNPVVRINPDVTMTVNGDIICVHPNSTIDILGILNVTGAMELKNNCYFCGTGVAYFSDLEIKNNGSCDGIVELYANSCSAKNNAFCEECIAPALPVNLLSFKAIARTSEIQLTWRTAQELENAFFSIEKSTTGKLWVLLAEVPSQSSMSGFGKYTYSDRQPAQGTNYYRLSQTDFDGKENVTGLTSIAFEKNQGINVALDEGTIMICSYKQVSPHRITISSMQGEIIEDRKLELGDGLLFQWSISHQPDGIYVVTISYPTGRESHKIALISL